SDACQRRAAGADAGPLQGAPSARGRRAQELAMADARLPQLLERGLRHFALGEIEHAVACWREVLAAEPRNRRAREYLELVASSAETPAEDGEGLELIPTDEVPWFAEPVTAVDESAQALEDWLGPENGDPHLPPVAAGTLPWQEWHSEVAL